MGLTGLSVLGGVVSSVFISWARDVSECLLRCLDVVSSGISLQWVLAPASV